MSETVKLFNPNDGVTGRPAGTYLDLELAKQREARSAKLEGRKPDYDIVQSVGIPLHTEAELKDRHYVPEVDIQEGKVSEKEAKHFEDNSIAEVKVSTDKGYRTSSAKEEAAFLKQGEKNRTEQGKTTNK